MATVAPKRETLSIRSPEDLVRVRQEVKNWAVRLGFNTIEQTKLVTAASELGRNTLIHGKGGTVLLEELSEAGRVGLRLTFEDQGPGIPDINMALKDGYTSGDGMGLGLGGARRLSNEFEITSRVGEGTRVRITQWKRATR